MEDVELDHFDTLDDQFFEQASEHVNKFNKRRVLIRTVTIAAIVCMIILLLFACVLLGIDIYYRSKSCDSSNSSNTNTTITTNPSCTQLPKPSKSPNDPNGPNIPDNAFSFDQMLSLRPNIPPVIWIKTVTSEGWITYDQDISETQLLLYQFTQQDLHNPNPAGNIQPRVSVFYPASNYPQDAQEWLISPNGEYILFGFNVSQVGVSLILSSLNYW